MKRTEFAAMIKSKYPDYQEIDDNELVDRVLKKYPDYQSLIDVEEPAAQQPKPIRTDAEIEAQGGLYADAFPRTFKAQMDDRGYARKAVGAGLDAASLMGRHLVAAPSFYGAWAATGDVDKAVQVYKDELSKIEADENSGNAVSRFIENVARDPVTALMLPIDLMTGGSTAGIRIGARQGVKTAVKEIGKQAAKSGAEGLASGVIHQGENVAAGEDVDLGEVAGETLLSAGMGSGVDVAGKTLKAVKKYTVPTSKTIVSKYTQIPEDALDRLANKQELEKVRKAMIETGGDLSNASADVVDLITDLRTRAQNEIESGIMTARPGGKIAPTEISPYVDGSNIEDAARNAKSNMGNQFGAEQERILSQTNAATRPLPKTRSVDYPYPERIKPQDDIDNILFEIGYNPKKGYSGNETWNNKAIGRGAIKELLKFKRQVGNAKNTGDLLTQLRNFRKRIDFGGENNGKLFPSKSDEYILMTDVDNRLRENIKTQLRDQAKDSGIADDLVNLWDANNASWKNTVEAISSVQNGIGIGRLNAEEYIGKIRDIGIKDLKNLKEFATKNNDIKPVWDEIQTGFFDNLVKRNIKEGSLDIAGFRKMWLSPEINELKGVLLDRDRIRQINKALVDIRKYGVKDVKDIGKNIEKGGVTKTLENIGSKDKRAALKELRFIEDIMGIPEAERLSRKASDVYTGKQVQMTKEGGIPAAPIITTGARNAGRIAGTSGGAAVGSFAGGPTGAVVGAYIGGNIGTYTQSPSAAIIAFKALNTLQKGFDVSAPVVKKGIDAAGTATAQQSVRTNYYQDNKEKNQKQLPDVQRRIKDHIAKTDSPNNSDFKELFNSLKEDGYKVNRSTMYRIYRDEAKKNNKRVKG